MSCGKKSDGICTFDDGRDVLTAKDLDRQLAGIGKPIIIINKVGMNLSISLSLPGVHRIKEIMFDSKNQLEAIPNCSNSTQVL